MVLLNGFDIAVLHIIAEDQLNLLSGLHVIPLRIKTSPKKKKNKKNKKRRRKSSHVVSVNLEGTRGEISEVDPTLTWHGLERENILVDKERERERERERKDIIHIRARNKAR